MSIPETISIDAVPTGPAHDLNGPICKIERLALSTADERFQAEIRALYARQARLLPKHQGERKAWCRAAFLEAGKLGLLTPNLEADMRPGRGRLLRSLLAHEERSYVEHVAADLPVFSNAAATDLIARVGTAAQKSCWLAQLMSGERIAAVALCEPGASLDPATMTTRAMRDGTEYVIDGMKLPTINAPYLDTLLVLAQLEGGQAGFFVLDGPSPVSGQLAGIRVPTARLLGEAAVASVELQRAVRVRQWERCARAVARSELALGLAIHCAKSTSLDGKPPFESQAVRFQLADLYAELLVTRAYHDDIVVRANDGATDAADLLMAELWVSQAEERIIGDSAQIIGPLALGSEYSVAALHDRARTERLLGSARETLRTHIFESVRRDADGSFDVLAGDRTTSGLSAEHEQYRASLRRFLQKEVEPQCKSWITSGAIPPEVQRHAAESGLLGVRIPIEAGGGGGDALYLLVASEEMGRSSAGPVVGPLFQSDGLVDLLLELGTPPQLEKWFPRWLRGDVPGFAVTEPGGGSDVRALRTHVRCDGDSYIINGSKCFISFGTRSDFFMILARTDMDDPTKLSFFLVDAKTPGIEPRRLKSKSHPCGDLCEIFLTDVRVPRDALLGEREGVGLKAVKNLFGLGHVQVAARAVGSMDLAYREALAYVSTRQAFGRKLIDFEHTQSVLAQMKTEMHVARRSLDYCYARYTRGTLDTATGSVAKLWHSNCEFRNIDKCFQFYGGAAFMSDHTISHHFLSARVQRVYDGTDEMQRQAISYAL